MILERCLLRRGARVTREGERTWRTLSHVDTAVDSVYTAGSALPPSVFAGMIVCYHPLSSLCPRLSRFNEKLFHPPYKYSVTVITIIKTRTPTRVVRRSACSVRRRNDLRFVLTGSGGPRARSPASAAAPLSCMYLLSSRGLTPADHANTQHTPTKSLEAGCGTRDGT